MTGTPVQNSLNDLRSLVQFLGIPQLENAASFQKHIAESGRSGQRAPSMKPNYENLRLLLGSTCLRRSISSLELGVTEVLEPLDFSHAEKEKYNELAISSRRSIDAAISGRQKAHGNRAMLTSLLRLRIFCNTGLSSHGAIRQGVVDNFNADEIHSLMQQSGEAPVCVTCNCDIPSSDPSVGAYDQNVDFRHPSKCLECRQLLTLSDDDLRSSQGYHDSVNDHATQLNPSPQESEWNRVSTTNSTNSDPSKYPSKLKAVLSDIMIHYDKEKR